MICIIWVSILLNLNINNEEDLSENNLKFLF
ncbi:hypothetical protein CPAST_c19700 [Clostridium pasteurianum DSM 525 = ATCC 6013]|uniref:Uncharacterized protein n=1 Tax=Clostridium pasteurianum DSM 525 = ATCC 6013 TaxID=1262449 RepID=A0A0H3J9W6_CLOPA|nr:hypothetical protein CPAST_c19700 [Clostridium pasteurianum DSM 525 = ATCC 6013]AJA52028.1 hypothetical protein CLPA_c19700 [Clostridium pasteurianum DSM 525 = ATCC 6013]KRU11962.1 hypothetical protein CP6013_01209 [Clostridium pasteurianum DSM 525 = ATCC 6013]